MNKTSREELVREVARLRRELEYLRTRTGAHNQPELAAAQLEEMFSALPDVVISLDGEGRYLKVLARWEDLLAARPEELEGNLVQDLLPPKTAELCLSVIQKTIASGQEQTIDYQLKTLDGWKWFEGRTSPLPEADGSIAKILWIARDITARKNAEEAVQNGLRQKDLLLKELYHRVNNNLQIVISLLKLQAGYVKDPETRSLLRRNHNRIYAMALIHEILYGSKDLSRIDFGRYLDILINYLFGQYSVKPRSIRLESEVGEVDLNINTAIPCGLILNELLTGALEGAGPDPPQGSIRVKICHQEPDQVEIMFARRGINFPNFPSDRNVPAFGSELIQTLVDQLGGVMEIGNGEWATWKINFSASDNQVEAGRKL